MGLVSSGVDLTVLFLTPRPRESRGPGIRSVEDSVDKQAGVADSGDDGRAWDMGIPAREWSSLEITGLANRMRTRGRARLLRSA